MPERYKGPFINPPPLPYPYQEQLCFKHTHSQREKGHPTSIRAITHKRVSTCVCVAALETVSDTGGRTFQWTIFLRGATCCDLHISQAAALNPSKLFFFFSWTRSGTTVRFPSTQRQTHFDWKSLLRLSIPCNSPKNPKNVDVELFFFFSYLICPLISSNR